MPATFIDAEGSVFDSGAEILVDPVNCVGVAGKGLALEFKKRWPPSLHERYVGWCKLGLLQPGSVLWWSDASGPDVVLFPTKLHWRDSSRLTHVAQGLVTLHKDLVARAELRPVASIAFPALGCGLGGLDWKDVRPLIVEALRDIDGLTVYLYGPQEKSNGA